MYELVLIIDADATRKVELKSQETGNTDICFDDSALVSDVNFDFMKIGEIYDCKIKLFVQPMPEQEGCIECQVINEDIIVGSNRMVEVSVDGNIYYTYYKKVKDFIRNNLIYFKCTRKDLIQVNEVIHQDLI